MQLYQRQETQSEPTKNLGRHHFSLNMLSRWERFTFIDFC